jgi:diguanylate cyclase (GGDEF)-like protein/PAS domain S-box-containing protein
MNSAQHLPTSVSLDRKLLSVTWPLIAIAVLMLSLCIASLSTLSSIRAFVNGEGMWSKAERQAIAELRRYAATGAPEYFQRFRDELAVPLGDRTARLQLQSADPDYLLASQGMIAGRSHPDDVPGMMRLLRLFRDSRLLQRPIAAWTQGDELIVQLDQVGQQLHSAMVSPQKQTANINRLLASAEQIHIRVAPLEDDFSTSLGNTSRQVLALLSIILTLCITVLVGIGAAISRITIRRNERIERALHETQEQAYVAQARSHVTLESIADAVLCTDQSQKVTYMNGAAVQLTGWSASEAAGQSLATVLAIVPESRRFTDDSAINRVLAGEQHSGATNGSVLRRRDGTTVPIHERAAPIRDSQGRVTGIVFVLRDITQEQALAAQLQHQATHDALTGLANRREFEHRLRLAIEDHQRFATEYALFYLDLDQFKVINDTCGHAAGDELICQVSWSIKQKLRESDVLARLGGDEFGVLLTACPQSLAMNVAESIRRHISELRFSWEGKAFVVNVSIGVLSLTESLLSVDDALSAADQACYLAKDNGRNRVQFYRPDDQEMRARHGEMQWVERLNTALETGRFSLYAQEIRPIAKPAKVRAGNEAPRFELLLRLVEDDGTLVAPMAFIPAAERYGLMPRIDRWVISNACSTLSALRNRHGVIPTCMINLSGASVNDAGLAEFVRSQLAQFGLPKYSIGFEVTETTAIANLATAAKLISRLKEIGCPIALDDFGSGMSSFGYLRSLPVDYLKIDGDFVKDMTADTVDYAVVEAIHHIGRVMGLQTVAESVESEDILTSLMLVGVDFAQGFHLAVPVPMLDMMRPTAVAGAADQAAGNSGSAAASA